MLKDFDSCSQISLHRKKNTDDEAEDELEGGGQVADDEAADDEAADDEAVDDEEPLASIFGTYGEVKVLVKRTPMKSEII